MEDSYQLVRDSKRYSECGRLLADGLNMDAEEKGIEPIIPFCITIENEKSQIMGGATGISIFGCIYTDMLWFENNLRSKGWGTKVMLEVEKIGKERGCRFATVNTMNWQALPFYQKLGYKIEFVQEGYEKESKMYMLRKSLL